MKAVDVAPAIVYPRAQIQSLNIKKRIMSKKLHTRNIVRLMIASGEYILIAKYKQGNEDIYFLPGRGIEYNESVIAATYRELEEEMGIVCRQNLLDRRVGTQVVFPPRSSTDGVPPAKALDCSCVPRQDKLDK